MEPKELDYKILCSTRTSVSGDNVALLYIFLSLHVILFLLVIIFVFYM